MSSRKWLLAVVLLITTSTGITWQLDIPAGWHSIETPEGLAEAVHVRICSSPAATWQNPAPPPGEAAIVVTFAGHEEAPKIDVFNNGRPDADAVAADIRASLARLHP